MRKLISAGLLLPLLASCSTMKAVQETAASATGKVKQFSLSDLRPARVDVVEVREKDLKEMPTGKERALAFEQKKKRTFWSFLPGTFKEPVLPEVSDSASDDYSLLPPKDL